MSFPRYPSYKESGVAWLGKVPEHWEVVPLKAAANVAVSGIDKKSKDDEERIRFLGTDTVYSSERITPSTELEECSASDDQVRSFSLLAEDVVITKDSVVPTMIAVASYVEQPPARAVCGYHLALLRSRPERAVGLFLFYSLKSSPLASYFLSSARGTTIIGIGAGIIGRAAIPLPPVREQTAIAEFLDRETGKIGELVAEQRRLMELLKEKRQAVISHAVTRGLNPQAKLKPSGIEWLGEVPGHWEVMTLRRCATYVQTGGTPSSEPPSADLEEGLVWFTPGDFGDSLRLTSSTRKISPAAVASGEAKVFPPKSVLVVSIGATLGKVGFAEEASSANQQINAVIPNERIDGYFLAYSLLVKAEVMRFLSNASTIGIMNQEKTKDIWIAVPPPTEQTGIAAFLDTELAKFDTLTAEAQRAIDLLQERRSALISAAVTGQIDVRPLTEKKAA